MTIKIISPRRFLVMAVWFAAIAIVMPAMADDAKAPHENYRVLEWQALCFPSLSRTLLYCGET